MIHPQPYGFRSQGLFTKAFVRIFFFMEVKRHLGKGEEGLAGGSECGEG